MDINKIIPNAESTEVLIEALKKRDKPAPSISNIKAQVDPRKHKIITDIVERPDKPVKNDDGTTRTEKVARIALALQKLIVKRMASFAFGNEVKNNAEPEGTGQESVLKALKRILHDNKSRSLNRKIARIVGTSTEVAEYWFPAEAKQGFKSYGFPSKYKLRHTIFSPLDGDELFPYFDATGDMIAFSRQFKRKEGVGNAEKDIVYFETYTDTQKVVWSQEEGATSWTEVSNTQIVIGMIPIVYSRQDFTEWNDVQELIERLEKLLSNFADTNDYHASPKIFVNGKVVGFAKKGESGAIIEGEKDAKAQYLSWEHAPESVKLEIETLLRMIYGLTQTPDISFDSIKGLGDISGIALKMLFLDAHLKVRDKEEIFLPHLQRRYSIVKSYIGYMSTSLKGDAEALEVEPEIIPYMVDDERALVDTLVTANGGKAIMSQKTGIAALGWVNDVDDELTQISQEDRQVNTLDIFETVE